jgi:hypothetical protein
MWSQKKPLSVSQKKPHSHKKPKDLSKIEARRLSANGVCLTSDEKRTLLPFLATFRKVEGGHYKIGLTAANRHNPTNWTVPCSVETQPYEISAPMSYAAFQALYALPNGCANTKLSESNGAIVGVTWHQAQKVIALLEKRDPGYSYRLPTEVEWVIAMQHDIAQPFWSTHPEWTQTQFRKFPYDGNDGREDVVDDQFPRVVRGWGSSRTDQIYFRYGAHPALSYGIPDGNFWITRDIVKAFRFTFRLVRMRKADALARA